MANTDQPNALTLAYIRAWQAIQREQDRIAGNPAEFRLRRRLAQMQARIAAILQELDDYSRAFIDSQFPSWYAAGGESMAAGMGMSYSFDSADQAAIRILADDLFDDLLARTDFMRRDTKLFIRRIVKDKVLTGEIKGETARQTKKRVADYLKKQGLRGVRYANGRMVPLDVYAEMAVRTKLATAQNTSGLLFAKRNGTNFVEIQDGPSCSLYSHSEGPLASGLVVSIKTAMTYRIAHPACRRSFGPRPEIRTKEEARNAKPSTAPGQREAQIEQDQQREQMQARHRAVLRRREAKITRAQARTG